MGNLMERDCLKDLGVDVNMILNGSARSGWGHRLN
jgi:hypothetical protein